MISTHLFRLGLILGCCWTAFSDRSIFDEVYSNADLQEFRKLVDRDPVVKASIEYSTLTVFAPTNAAIAKHTTTNIRKEVVSYHVASVLLKQDLFPVTQASQLARAAPLYLSVREDRPPINSHDYFQTLHKKEYFVNNAKILSDRLFKSKDGNNQLLYIIDELLEPYIPSTPLPPPALDVIRQPSIYGIEESWGQFFSKIESTQQTSLFEENANHTFFVPIDLSKPSRFFDEYVVRGHVIPNRVLFLRTMGKESYQSSAFDGNVNVELSLINRTARINNEQSYYVQSNTLKSDPKHNKGVVMSQVIRANIPVRNGVIHLIKKPLMIIDNSIADFLEEEKNGRLSTFNQLINFLPEIRSEISRLDQKTILAPTDLAFSNLNEGAHDNKLAFLMQNPQELKKLLHLHMAAQSVSTDDIRSGTKADILTFDNRNLYFRVVGDDKNKRLTVEGGGVNATAIQADIGATNGIIHIIDRVLGMPFQNIHDKLRSDPDLSFTYQLGIHDNENWNERLGREDQRFTYFVPSNAAWDQFGREFPSEYKQLKEKLYPSQTRAILDRLLVVNQQISSQQLEGLTEVYTKQGLLTVKRIAGYANPDIEWEGIRARIIRPDVHAINGVIHVIDTVLMKQRDLSVNSSNATFFSTTLLIIAIFITKLY